MTEIADNPQVPTQDIISKHVGESTQNLVQKLRGGETRKRKRAPSAKRNTKPSARRNTKPKKKAKRARTTKGDIFS